jgi:transcriptional regulator with XRE-family HTH domain
MARLWTRQSGGMREFSDAFSEVVREARERKKLSRNALARMAGLHQTYIGLLERGERSPNLDTAKAIARALGLPLAMLVARAEKK